MTPLAKMRLVLLASAALLAASPAHAQNQSQTPMATASGWRSAWLIAT
jgi:hypothetical protein